MLGYFDSFNKTKYELQDSNKRKEAVNIFNAVLLQRTPVNYTSVYYTYNVQDGERPEHISFNLYGTVDHHWTILLMNDIVDPYYDWILDPSALSSYIDDKYGDGAEDIKYFIDLTKTDRNGQYKRVDDYDYRKYLGWMDAGTPLPQNISPVTFAEYEVNKNNEKREIKVIDASYINKFVDQFDDLMERNIMNIEDL